MIIFESARLKLTLWYVLISLVISLFFSVAIFFLLDFALEGSYQRFERRFTGRLPPPDYLERLSMQRQEIEQIENQTRLYLIYINLIILGISGTAGYFLAGRTLKPIKIMVEDQNRFIADASHEIRTPLTALKTEIEVSLRDKNLDLIKAKKVLKENLEDIDSLKKLSDYLLSLTRVEQIDIKPGLTPILLCDIINSAKTKVINYAKRKKIQIVLSCDKTVILGDRDQLSELFVIFLDNAIKYSNNKGKVFISSIAKDKHAEIKIEDNGIGINKEDLPYIFDRFYRSEKSRTKNIVPGYGLGLAIAKQIIEAQKGSVSVESVLGKGTTFTVKLPIYF